MFSDKLLVVFPVFELTVEIASDVKQYARGVPGRKSCKLGEHLILFGFVDADTLYCRCMSLSQSGFRRGRSTVDVSFGYSWLRTKAQRQRVPVEFLSIDLSRFRHHSLRPVDRCTLDFPPRVGTADDHLLVADTSLEPRLSSGDNHAFAITIGTPQDQYSSPSTWKRHFATYNRFFRHALQPTPACLAEWSLTINTTKTEGTTACRHVDRINAEWRMTRKLGSLLHDAEDAAVRKQLANVNLRKLWTVWLRQSLISLQLRLRLYASFVMPVLT